MAYIYSLADTWNASGTTFTGIGLNVTDTASAAASMLMDLQIGGTSRFSIGKGGFATGYTIKTNTSGEITNNNTSGFTFSWGSNLLTLDSIGIKINAAYLTSDAANTLAQRNSTAAQAFNLYNTYTDASNYERGFMRWSSNQFRVGTEKAGTGAASNGFLVADGLTALQWGGFGGGFATMSCGLASASVGVSDLGYSAGIGGAFRRLHLTQFVETVEMTAPAAPAANGVRIYAEDNGSGKTRLMALFATGVAQQIAIEP